MVSLLCQQQQAKQKQTLSSNLKQLEGLPFWIWDKQEHRQRASRAKGNGCFNHILGLPIKNYKEYPIFEFQKQIYDSLEISQNIWIKKARGIGVTTFIIRYLVWKYSLFK